MFGEKLRGFATAGIGAARNTAGNACKAVAQKAWNEASKNASDSMPSREAVDEVIAMVNAAHNHSDDTSTMVVALANGYNDLSDDTHNELRCSAGAIGALMAMASPEYFIIELLKEVGGDTAEVQALENALDIMGGGMPGFIFMLMLLITFPDDFSSDSSMLMEIGDAGVTSFLAAAAG